MGISSSLNAGVQGLGVNASKLATISDNIANSATNGYKRATTSFSSIVLEETASRYTAGGVRATTSRDILARGQLQATGSATDFAIDGRGFLPVASLTDPSAASAGNFPLSLKTTGSFNPDAEGFLVDGTGLFLLGWPLTSDGAPAGPQPRDSTSGLVPVNLKEREFAASPTTAITVAANLPSTATEAGADPATFDLPVAYFDNLGATRNLTLTFSPQIPATGSSNTWSLDVVDDASPAPGVIGAFDIVFEDGRTAGGTVASVTSRGPGSYDPVTGELALAVAGGPMTVSIGRPGTPGGLSQLAGEFAPVQIAKNGATFGSLARVEMSGNGVLTGIFDNGERQSLFRVPVVDVPNPNGLKALNGQAFAVSLASGGFYLWDAGDGPVGGVLGGALEASTTDIAQELTDLIQTQRAYSSNAKIIQTVDEMLQETTNIKR